MADALVKIVLQGDEATAGADRFSQALGRLERSEPTMALRRTRFAIDELTASATGLPPVLGRLVSIFAQMGIGGATGIAAVGAFAAIGASIKSVLDYTNSLDTALEKLNQRFAQSVPSSGKLHELGSIAEVLSPNATEAQEKAFGFPEQPGVLDRLFSRLQGSLFGDASGHVGPGDIERAFQSQTAAAIASAENLQQAATTANAKEHAKAQNAMALAIGTASIALEKAKLGAGATSLQLFDLAAKAEILKAHINALDNPEAARVEHLTRERVALERVNAVNAERLQKTLPYLGTGHVPFSWEMEPSVADIGVMAKGGGTVGRWHTEPKPESHLASDIVSGVAGALALAGGISRGDPGSVVSGLGGAVSAIGAIKGVPGPIGIAGTVLSGLGGLMGLFTSGQARTTITAFEGQALAEIRNLRADPLTSQFILVDSRDVRADVYRQGRLARRDGVSRGY